MNCCGVSYNQDKEGADFIAGLGRTILSYSWYNELPQRKRLSPRPLISTKMLASRTLPPITSRSPSPPIATFVNIPRRYYKAKMQATDVASGSKMQDVQPASNTRKSSRINDSPSSDVENSAQRSAASKGPTSAPLLPLAPRKRTASVGANGTSFEVGDSPTNSRPGSATSTGSGEISGHICLCPPEPKIPRPRNGKSALFVISDLDIPERSGSLRTKKMVFVCGQIS